MTEQIKYRERTYKYQLAETYSTRIPIYPPEWLKTDFISLSPSGDLTILVNYAWDGPSGPTVDTKGAMRGSLIHDSIYQLLRLGLLKPMWRAKADLIYEACVMTDSELRVKRDLPKKLKFAETPIIAATKLRAELHFKALRGFGAGSAKRGTEPPILTAP